MIAYECYDCKYEGKDPENLCLQPSEDSGKVSIESISQLRGSVISAATILLLKLNHKTDLRRCETTKGCEKHYIERTIAGETIYEIERSCKRDDVCYSEYVNCHDVHVSFHQSLREFGINHMNGVKCLFHFLLKEDKDKIGQECESCCSGNLCNDVGKDFLNPIMIICIILFLFLK